MYLHCFKIISSYKRIESFHCCIKKHFTKNQIIFFCLGQFPILLWVVWFSSCTFAPIVHVGDVPHSLHADTCVCVCVRMCIRGISDQIVTQYKHNAYHMITTQEPVQFWRSYMNRHTVAKFNTVHPTLPQNSTTFTIEFSYEQ